MKLINKLLNLLFDRDNINAALAALPVALVELTQYSSARVTKDGLIRALAIRKHNITDKQFDYLIRDLPQQMSRLGYSMVVKNDEIWISKNPVKHKRFIWGLL